MYQGIGSNGLFRAASRAPWALSAILMGCVAGGELATDSKALSPRPKALEGADYAPALSAEAAAGQGPGHGTEEPLPAEVGLRTQALLGARDTGESPQDPETEEPGECPDEPEEPGECPVDEPREPPVQRCWYLPCCGMICW